MSKTLIYFSFFIFIVSGAGAVESVRWGIDNNFRNEIFRLDNVEQIKSGNNPVYYEIKKNKTISNNKPDLYLTFDKDNQGTVDSNYRYMTKNFFFKEKGSYIKESGYFFKTEHKIELAGNENSFFRNGVKLPSFSVGFWVCPSNIGNNEGIFKIGSQFYDIKRDAVEDQSIVGTLNQGKFSLIFNNMFSLDSYKKESLRIDTYKSLKIGEWNSINIKYDAFTGLIKVLVNGVEAGIACATTDGTIDGSVLNMIYSPKNRCIITIGSGFTGAIDEFVVIPQNSDIETELYNSAGGALISQVINLDGAIFDVDSVDFLCETPDYSAAQFFIRYSDRSFIEDDTVNVVDKLEWVKFDKQSLRGKKIKFFQWKVVLLPGISNKISPRFLGLTLKYNKNLVPNSPTGIIADSVDGKIRVRWNSNSERDIAGYKIYYGIKPDNYFCSEANEGESPIIVKNNYVELTGLTLNKIYYIRISAFDTEGENHESEFSDEIFIRCIK